MPTVEENRTQWDETFNWDLEQFWSARWGGDDMQWYGSILPRIHAFVPAGTILELGPGFGRNTQFLAPLCEKLILVDVAPKCIDACREKFGTDAHIEYHVNDGVSLDMVAPGSIDFAFSFESLVHADESALSGYIAQLAEKLAPGGVAFLHHSNLGAYPRHHAFWARIRPFLRSVPAVQRLLRRVVDDAARGWRDPSVHAQKVHTWCEANGLVCISQELLTHFTRYLLKDCFSLIAKRGSKWERECIVLENRHYELDARRFFTLSQLYAPRNLPEQNQCA
jgi:SAM-dependent methyltransferase